ncbi:MAG: hypothetical protein ABSE85_05020 [Candidatus Korobacteraceae bacterium]|jgi:hypothetical protein
MRLIACLPCEKIIIDAKGVPSLITLITTVEIGPIPAEGFPEYAAGPNPWWVFVLWEGDENDRGTENVQKISIHWPDGKEFVQTNTPFVIDTPEKPGLKHSISSQIIGFPLGQHGDVLIRVWLERDGATLGEAYEYTFFVKHISGVPFVP